MPEATGVLLSRGLRVQSLIYFTDVVPFLSVISFTSACYEAGPELFPTALKYAPTGVQTTTKPPGAPVFYSLSTSSRIIISTPQTSFKISLSDKPLAHPHSWGMAQGLGHQIEPGLGMQIPLPGPSEEGTTAREADLQARVAVGPDALPSVIFHTFVNTHRSLHCSAFSHNGAWLAGVVASCATWDLCCLAPTYSPCAHLACLITPASLLIHARVGGCSCAASYSDCHALQVICAWLRDHCFAT